MTDSDDKDLKHFLEQMFKAFDTDKSGNMTFDELMMVCFMVVTTLHVHLPTYWL